MANKTLLEIVQDILVDINGDEINSITDTAESEQVANIVRKTYLNIVSNSNWAHTRRLTVLVPYSDNTKPTHFYLADNVKELISVNYNISGLGETRKMYKTCTWLEPDHFLVKTNSRDSSSSTVQTVVDPSGVELFIYNNKHPEYYTSFDDSTVVFDSFDNEVDSTLQDSKLQVLAYIIPDFALSDGAVPDLPPDAFALLLEEATSRCQWKLREFQDAKSEQEAGRQRRWMSRKAWRTNSANVYPNYGKRTI